MRLQLPLKIPRGEYRFLVGGEEREWKEGSVVGFEEAKEHEVWAKPEVEGDDQRILLIVDVLHPHLFS